MRRTIPGITAALLGLSLTLTPASHAAANDCTTWVALTFDDGPSYYRPQTLRTLRGKQAPATFFDVGVRVQANPQLARAEVADGHLALNHTWDHPNLTALSRRRIRSEVTRAEQALADAGAPMPFKVLRPPYGLHNSRVDSELAGLGYTIAPTWDDSVNDWDPTVTAQQIHDTLIAGLHPGAIILMHDGAVDTTNGSADEDALPGIIDDIRGAGYCLGQLDARAWVVPAVPQFSGEAIPDATNPVPYLPPPDGGTPPDPYVIISPTTR